MKVAKIHNYLTPNYRFVSWEKVAKIHNYYNTELQVGELGEGCQNSQLLQHQTMYRLISLKDSVNYTAASILCVNVAL